MYVSEQLHEKREKMKSCASLLQRCPESLPKIHYSNSRHVRVNTNMECPFWHNMQTHWKLCRKHTTSVWMLIWISVKHFNMNKCIRNRQINGSTHVSQREWECKGRQTKSRQSLHIARELRNISTYVKISMPNYTLIQAYNTHTHTHNDCIWITYGWIYFAGMIWGHLSVSKDRH